MLNNDKEEIILLELKMKKILTKERHHKLQENNFIKNIQIKIF